jgi:hypothetical protein
MSNPVGRPSKYKPEYCEAVIAHMSDGASLTSFAAEIDVARSTINEWMEEHPQFSESVKRGKAKCAAWWERKGREGASGEAQVNPTLVIFGLKNMAGEDWREKQEIDHKSSDSSMSPTRIEIVAARHDNGTDHHSS